MKNTCKFYNEEIISKFVDNELSPDERKTISAHINKCPICSDLAEKYTRMSDLFIQNTSKQIDKIDKNLLKQNILEQINREENIFLKKVFDYFSPKFYLKVASVLAILVVSLVYFQVHPINEINNIGSSAIVNSVDGDVSSVMIFETEKSKHTIIWFSEA